MYPTYDYMLNRAPDRNSTELFYIHKLFYLLWRLKVVKEEAVEITGMVYTKTAIKERLGEIL